MTFSPDAVPASPAGPPTLSAGPPAPASPASARRLDWLWPALATGAIGGFQLDRAPLWRDELATWSAATRSTADLLRLTAHTDGVSGPYYLLMHGWISVFGDSVTALRAPALLCMAGAAALTTRLGQRLCDARTGLIAGLLLAVLPSTSRYAQEARAYAPTTLFAVLATLLLVRALDDPRWTRWWAYSAALAGLGLTHLVALTLLAGHAVAVLAIRRRGPDRRLLRWPAALIPVALVLSPVLTLGQHQHARQLAWVPRPGIADLCALPGTVLQAGVVGGMLVGLAALGAASRGRTGVILGLSILLPVLLLFLGGLLSPLWVPRYLVFLVPLGCLLAAAALAPLRLPAMLPAVLALAAFGAPAQAQLRRTHEWPRSQPVDYPGAARLIAANREPADGIVYSPRDRWAFLDTAIAYYLRGPAPRDVLLDRDPVDRAELSATECAQPARCLAGTDRLWLLARGEHRDPLRALTGSKAVAVRNGFTVVRTWRVPGLTLALLGRTRR